MASILAGPYVILFVVVAFIVQQVIANIIFHRRYRFPNPVPGWPIIGNMLDVPFPGIGVWQHELAKKYGEMFTLNLGGKKVVYLNSSRVVTDLLDKRANKYSSRAPRPMLNDIMSGGARILLMGYDNRWRAQRKVMHSILNTQQAESKFTPFQDLEAKQLAYEVYKDPDNYFKASQRFANSVILSVIFGRRARRDDELLNFIMNYTMVLGQYLSSPFTNPADNIAWLNYLPKYLQWWRSSGDRFFKAHVEMYQKEYDLLLEKIDKGTAKPCFALDVINGAAKKEFEISEVEKIYTWSSLIEAGSDTSRVAIQQMMAAAACYPEWAQKARKLLDEVLGENAERLPSLKDRPALPYITAVVKETLRWRPFNQSGFPRTLSEDDEYEGYRFPAGTEFTWNAYSIALNENEYDDPLRFIPERFLNDDIKAMAKGHWAFGAGRRICVGLNVGANNIWIAAATLLYCFDFEEDPMHPIDQLNSVWEDTHNAPFHIKIKPRSPAHADLIEREGAIALATTY